MGSHRVEITSYRSSDGKVYEDPLATTVPQTQLLPAKFNTESVLVRDVPAENPFTLDFELRE